MAVRSRPSAFEELLGRTLQVLGHADLNGYSNRPALQAKRALIGVYLDLGPAPWTAGVDLCSALVVPRSAAFTAQLHRMYIVEHSRCRLRAKGYIGRYIGF
jgi:hypothetical protein